MNAPAQIILIDTDELLVSVIPRDSESTTLCFTGIGHAIGGVDIQSYEFIKSSQNSTTIFVVDRKRSWGNNIDFDLLIKRITPYTEGKIVNSIGNSMGAFLAILATKFISISSCIAFVPQFSVNRSIVPNENRFDQYVNDISNWKFISLADAFNNNTAYYVFFGKDNGLEDKHRALIPIQKNISMFVFKDAEWSHNVAQNLKEVQLLYPVIKSCFELRNLNEIIQEHLSNYAMIYDQ